MEIDSSPSSSSSGPSSINTAQNADQKPILIVTFVSSSSPADACGLRPDDKILDFGSINFTNFKELKQISELTLHRKNEQILLKIKRNDRIQNLTLIPKEWSGRGLLGCNIVLADSNAH